MPIFKVGFVVIFDRRCKDTNNMWGLQELHERRKKLCATDSRKPFTCKLLQRQLIFFAYRPYGRKGWFQPTPSPTRCEEQAESRRCQNVSRSKCVIFVFGCPGSFYIKYIFLIYILYRPLTALSFFILTHFDLDPFWHHNAVGRVFSWIRLKV